MKTETGFPRIKTLRDARNTSLRQYSKSSRARCRLCSKTILKGLSGWARSKVEGGQYGFINSWHHLKCARIDDENPEQYDASEIVWGFNFEKADKKRGHR